MISSQLSQQIARGGEARHPTLHHLPQCRDYLARRTLRTVIHDRARSVGVYRGVRRRTHGRATEQMPEFAPGRGSGRRHSAQRIRPRLVSPIRCLRRGQWRHRGHRGCECQMLLVLVGTRIHTRSIQVRTTRTRGRHRHRGGSDV